MDYHKLITIGEYLMKNKLLLTTLSLLLLSCMSSYGFNGVLPSSVVCSGPQPCVGGDPDLMIDGWVLSSESGSYIKPGSYSFTGSLIAGNPNDGLYKTVVFRYHMVDTDGYNYYVSYQAANWIIPVKKDKYIKEGDLAKCTSTTDITDCYVDVVAPRK